MRSICFLFITAAFCLSGCQQDIQSIADEHVEKDILRRHEKRDAIDFLEHDGVFFDDEIEESDDAATATSVDRQIVLPMLKELKQISLTDQWAMLRPEVKNSAYGILVELPRDPDTVDKMAQAVQNADDKFAGFILQQWGHNWLLMDLIDQETYEFLKKSDPEMDIQR